MAADRRSPDAAWRRRFIRWAVTSKKVDWLWHIAALILIRRDGSRRFAR